MIFLFCDLSAFCAVLALFIGVFVGFAAAAVCVVGSGPDAHVEMGNFCYPTMCEDCLISRELCPICQKITAFMEDQAEASRDIQ